MSFNVVNTRANQIQESGPDRSLMCKAQGCPNRWSVDKGDGGLCSAHAWSQAREWPAITQQQLDAETDRARWAQREKPAAAPMTAERRRKILADLIALTSAPKTGREWAVALRDREQGGELLTRTQREAWREVLGAQ
jgi:hypothetical protein